MEDELFQYISRFMDLDEETEKALSEADMIRKYPKGTVLLREGDICGECFFILKGLIRSYCQRDGEEITTDFHREEQVVTPTCYGTGAPSGISLECLEETIACVGTPSMEEDLYGRYPRLESLSRLIGEKLISDVKVRFDAYRMSTPEQRYLDLVENNPSLLQRVPQYQIASYLGIKPESLSRIRKRITRRNRG